TGGGVRPACDTTVWSSPSAKSPMLRDDSDASSARASGLAGCCAATDAGVPVGCSRTVITLPQLLQRILSTLPRTRASSIEYLVLHESQANLTRGARLPRGARRGSRAAADR